MSDSLSQRVLRDYRKELFDFIDRSSNSPEPSLSRDNDAYHSVVAAAFREFSNLERNYLLNLSDNDARLITIPQGQPSPHISFQELAASICRHHVEFLLTLKGINPCMGVWSHSNEAHHVIIGLLLKCLVPVVKRYELHKYGFELRDASLLEPSKDPFPSSLQSGCIFVDKNSSLFPEANTILESDNYEVVNLHYGLANYNESVVVARTKKEFLSYQDRSRRALGVPICCPRQDSVSWIWYSDERERKYLTTILGADHRCPVIGFGYTDGPAGILKMGRFWNHFKICRDAMKSVGSELHCWWGTEALEGRVRLG